MANEEQLAMPFLQVSSWKPDLSDEEILEKLLSLGSLRTTSGVLTCTAPHLS